MPDVVACIAIGIAVFIALHQHVLGRSANMKTSPITDGECQALLRGMLDCCRGRVTMPGTATALVEAVVVIAKAAAPSTKCVWHGCRR